MNETQVSIGQVKRDISELVNRVAYGGERIILTSRGKPKAVIISLAEYQHIAEMDKAERMARWEAWKAEKDKWAAKVLAEREGEPVDVDALWDGVRQDLESRHDFLLDR